MPDMENSLLVALKKVDKLQGELIEVEKVIKVALLDNLQEDVGSLLDSLIQSFIPNLVAQIDKILELRNLKTPKFEEDEEQMEAYQMSGDVDVSFIKEELLCDEILDDDDGDGNGDEHFHIIPDCDFEHVIIKEESIDEVGEEMFEDLQILPDDYQGEEQRTNLQESQSNARKRGRPRKTEKSESKVAKSNGKVQNVPILPKTIVVHLNRLSEHAINNTSSPPKVVQLLPVPSTQKFRLIAPKIVQEQSPNQNSTIQSTVNEETLEPIPQASAPIPSSSSESIWPINDVYVDPKISKIKRQGKKPGRKPNPNKVIPKKPTKEEIDAYNEQVEAIDVKSLPGPPFNCPLCQKFCSARRDRLKRHLLSHYKKLGLQCPKCPSKRKSEARLKEHIQLKHSQFFAELYNPKPPKIETHGYSEEQFVNSDDAKFPFKCPVCWKPFPKRSKAVSHIELHSSEKKHRCSECDKSFRLQYTLNAHISTCHPQGSEVGKSFTCFHSECSKTFATAPKLRQHLLKAHQNLDGVEEDPKFAESVAQFMGTKANAVLNRKPLECDVCQRKFKTRTLLNKHQWRHNPNLLKFICSFPGCSKKFGSKKFLRNHLAVHSDEKKFVCKECGATFKYRSSVVSHKRRLHPTPTPKEAKFSCKLCAKKFPSQGPLTVHLNKEHFGKGHECEKCFQIFVEEEELKVHKETVHFASREKDENYKRRTPKVKTS